MQLVYELIVPETVEAIPVTRKTETWIVSWCKGAIMEDINPATQARTVLGVYVPTLQGLRAAPYGTWVVRKRSGDFCVMTSQKFQEKFRLVR